MAAARLPSWSADSAASMRGNRIRSTDFCTPGIWERERCDLPSVLAEVRDRQRTDREVAHLSSHRLGIPAATKDWPVGEIMFEIVTELEHLSIRALPERMDTPTRTAVADLFTHSWDVGPESVATGTFSRYTGSGHFPNFWGS
jgi:hypothetical protein